VLVEECPERRRGSLMVGRALHRDLAVQMQLVRERRSHGRTHRECLLKKAQTWSVFCMKLLLLPTRLAMADPAPALVPQSELPNQQCPPPVIEQPVTSTFGHVGHPAKVAHVVSPPLGGTATDVVVVEHPLLACKIASEGFWSE
jgi:hypothetical protein